METLLQARIRIQAAKGAKDLRYGEWLQVATPMFIWTWAYQVYIQRHVQMVIDGIIDRLQISVPPRHGKSEKVTVRLPVYMLERDPTFRTIVGAYSQALAKKFSRKTRRLAIERGVPVARDSKAVDDWETDTGAPVPGGVRAAGVGVGVTGMGANGIIIDDPVKNRAEANSEVYRNNTHDWYKDDIYTRLEPGGWVIMIMTRWHEDDLAGRTQREEGLRSEGGEWTVINLPATAEDQGDPLGRKPGEALCPERYNEEALARIKKVLRDSYYALYQGRPVAAEGNLVKRQWFRYYGNRPAANVTIDIVQSWDTASKNTQLADYSVCTTWAVTRLGFYLLDVFREQLNYPDLLIAAKRLANDYKPGAVLIEDKASGQALIQDLKSNTMLPVIAIEPEMDKITRMVVETSQYESGMVLHPESAPWLPDYENELTSFPLAANDDQVDSTSQFVGWARRRAFTFNWAGIGIAPAGVDGFDEPERKIKNQRGWGSVQSTNDFGGY